MSKRKWIAVILAAVAFTACAVAVELSRPGVTRRNFSRVEPGMTLEEVSDLLGQPWTHTEPKPSWGTSNRVEYDASGAVVTHFWGSEEFTAQVGFDATGVVVWKGVCPPPIPWKEWARPSWWQQLRRRIGL